MTSVVSTGAQHALYLVARFHLRPVDRASLRLACRALAYTIHFPCALKRFHHIDPANEHAEKCKGLRVWAMDIWIKREKRYSKCFWAGTLSSFVRTMQHMERQKKERCFYEIIHHPDNRLLSACGTHAYLDLEYERQYCTHSVPDDDLTQRIVKEFINVLRKEFTASEGGEDRIVVKPIVLTAHNEKKYSVHAIFWVRVNGVLTLFPDNYAVGAVVRKWEFQHERTPWHYYLQDDGKYKFITDEGVYSFRRQIRTLNSTKMGQGRYLMCADPQVTLVDTMIQNHDYGTSRNFRTPAPPMLTHVTEIDGRAPEGTSNFWGPFLASKGPSSSSAKRANNGHDASSALWKRPKINCVPQGTDLLSRCADWIASLDPGTHVDKAAKNPKYPGSYMFTTNSRMCRIRERDHRGNKVYYTIRLGDMFARQKCHDGDCMAEGKDIHVDMPQSLMEHMTLAVFYDQMVKGLMTR